MSLREAPSRIGENSFSGDGFDTTGPQLTESTFRDLGPLGVDFRVGLVECPEERIDKESPIRQWEGLGLLEDIFRGGHRGLRWNATKSIASEGADAYHDRQSNRS